jgi:hypothetical protein
MFSSFLGKGKGKSEGSSTKDAAESRGLEVVEDDPDTTWGLWEDAVADQDSRLSGDLPPHLSVPDAPHSFENTQPMGFFANDPQDRDVRIAEPTQARTRNQIKDDALMIVELHHHRIAKSIRTLWGYKECSDYITKLIMDGGDSKGNARMGCNQDAAAAMMVLSDLHDDEFGTFGGAGELGFADPTVRAGFDGSR